MNSKQILAALGIASTLLAAGPATGCASTGDSAPPAAKLEMKTEVKAVETTPDVVTVTTKDYTFTAQTPAGWTGDTEGAKKYQGSYPVHPEGGAGHAGGGQILVSVYHKFDENVGLRLETDTQNYRKQYPKLELGELDVEAPAVRDLSADLLPGRRVLPVRDLPESRLALPLRAVRGDVQEEAPRRRRSSPPTRRSCGR